ncbi:MAG: cell wall hydrolase [Lamprobacter sp.]|uniref:cell wall hydrolase n=1 Tax=Lamprobacter sp. TaxID=3100796 RepID=UPI002B2580B1|nr:cell wall hydrolase [Lamprobacter sp.]MEA3638881.1 cell wall hydrolase [Lamprobacter sp.]
MRTLSITAFVATLFPSVLLSPAFEPRETLRLNPTEIKLEPVSETAPPHVVLAAKSTAPVASAIPPRAPTARAIDPNDHVDEELHCLALNIYHEARSEPLSGQLAVAKVTLNRVRSTSFPESICGVVKQGSQKRNRCQFSWWCDGKSDEPTELKAWQKSLELGRRVLAGEVADPTQGALYYHATYVSPKWSRSFQRTTQIGRHLFYRPTASTSQS